MLEEASFLPWGTPLIPLETECTEDRSSVALCNLVHHGHLLPPPFQNFDSIPHVSSLEVGYYGGSVALADYCPYVEANTRCEDPVNTHQQSYDLKKQNFLGH